MIEAIDSTGRKVPASTYIETVHGSDLRCLNPNCPARLCHVRANGEHVAYFRALPSRPHSPLCDYAHSSGGQSHYTDNGFIFNNAFDNLMNSGTHQHAGNPQNTYNQLNSQRLILPRTLKSIYFAMLDHIDGQFGDVTVADVLCCDETFARHSQLNGRLIVKARFGYNTGKSQTLGLYYPCLINGSQIKLEIYFPDHTIYNRIFNEARSYRAGILIAGDFHNNTCTVAKLSQIVVFKS